MEIHIEQAGPGLEVRIEGIAGCGDLVLERIRLCRQTAWACASGECLNIAEMEEHAEAGRVLLTLTPRTGERLSATGIEHCLRCLLQPVVR